MKALKHVVVLDFSILIIELPFTFTSLKSLANNLFDSVLGFKCGLILAFRVEVDFLRFVNFLTDLDLLFFLIDLILQLKY